MINDTLCRFLLDDLDIAGAVVRLGPPGDRCSTIATIRRRFARLLGEMTATTLLLGGKLKQPGRLTASSCAATDRSRCWSSTATSNCRSAAWPGCSAPRPNESAADCSATGSCNWSLDMPSMREPYQSIVPLAGDQHRRDLRALPRSVGPVAGTLVSRRASRRRRRTAPAENCRRRAARRRRLGAHRGARRNGQARELLSLPAEELLRRLFPRRNRSPVCRPDGCHNCPEDWEKVRSLLLSLGPKRSMPRCTSKARWSSRTTSAIANTVSTRSRHRRTRVSLPPTIH
jgi:molecular chaperone Hsp33